MQGAPEVQGAAAQALAHIYAAPAVAAPLFTAPVLLERTMQHWIQVVDLIADSSVRVVHAGMLAVDRMLSALRAAQAARDGQEQEGLQSVLAHLAWAGAIRLRATAAHCLACMARMPAAMQVDSMTALASTLDLIMAQDAPVRLDAFGAMIPNPDSESPTSRAEVSDPFADPTAAADAAADAAPSALHPPVSDGWVFHALGTFCLTRVDAADAAAATEASRVLLHLKWLHETLHFPRLHVATVPQQWARTAMSALLRIGDPQVRCFHLPASSMRAVARSCSAADSSKHARRKTACRMRLRSARRRPPSSAATWPSCRLPTSCRLHGASCRGSCSARQRRRASPTCCCSGAQLSTSTSRCGAASRPRRWRLPTSTATPPRVAAAHRDRTAMLSWSCSRSLS